MGRAPKRKKKEESGGRGRGRGGGGRERDKERRRRRPEREKSHSKVDFVSKTPISSISISLPGRAGKKVVDHFSKVLPSFLSFVCLFGRVGNARFSLQL